MIVAETSFDNVSPGLDKQENIRWQEVGDGPSPLTLHAAATDSRAILNNRCQNAQLTKHACDNSLKEDRPTYTQIM